MPQLTLFTQSAKLDQVALSSQLLVNWYFETFGTEEAKYTSALMPIDGADRVCVVGADPTDLCRGLYYSSSGTAPDFAPRLYGVWGNKVYRSNAEITAMTQIGFCGDFATPVSMTDNGFYFVVVDGFAMYKASLTDADGVPFFYQVTLPIVPKTGLPATPSHVAFIGQRLVCNSTDTNFFFYSNFTDPTTLVGGETFEDASFYSAESSSDTILALKVVNGSLWLWGMRSYEIWSVSQNRLGPFSYVGGSSYAIGLQSAYSVAVVGDLCFWLGSSDVGTSHVYMAQGTSVKQVSVACFDQIRKMSNKDKAIGYGYADKGHIFYVLTFQSDNMTFVYDASTDKWHNRLMRDVDAGEWRAYPYGWITVGNGNIYSGLLSDENALCKFSLTTETEWDGRMVLREATSVTYNDNMDVMNLQQITLDCEVGTTLALNGYQSDPEISLAVSKDGGFTFGNFVTKSLGKQGVYGAIVRWFNLGSARRPVFRLRTTKKLSIFMARLDYRNWGRS